MTEITPPTEAQIDAMAAEMRATLANVRLVAPLWPKMLSNVGWDPVGWRATSYHEAAHVVAGIAVGFRVSGVELANNGNLGPTATGRTNMTTGFPPNRALWRERLSDAQLDAWSVQTLCGPIAEGRAVGTLAVFENTHIHEDEVRALGRDVEALSKRAHGILDTHWPAVTAVAEALMRRGELDKHDIARLMRRHIPEGKE